MGVIVGVGNLGVVGLEFGVDWIGMGAVVFIGVGGVVGVMGVGVDCLIFKLLVVLLGKD